MPLSIALAHGLARQLDDVRRKGVLPYLAPAVPASPNCSLQKLRISRSMSERGGVSHRPISIFLAPA